MDTKKIKETGFKWIKIDRKNQCKWMKNWLKESKNEEKMRKKVVKKLLKK